MKFTHTHTRTRSRILTGGEPAEPNCGQHILVCSGFPSFAGKPRSIMQREVRAIKLWLHIRVVQICISKKERAYREDSRKREFRIILLSGQKRLQQSSLAYSLTHSLTHTIHLQRSSNRHFFQIFKTDPELERANAHIQPPFFKKLAYPVFSPLWRE